MRSDALLAGAEEDRDGPGLVRGRPFEEVKAIDALPRAEAGWHSLFWSDYCAHYRYKLESDRRRRLFLLPRVLTNASMHACLLVRLLQGTPRYLTWFWRRLLITFHASDFQPHCRIGPGLRMPHPIGILVGHGVLGRNVVLQHHITLSAVTSNWDSGQDPGLFHIGDGVTIFTGSVLAGRIAVGDDAVIGANSLVVRDIPAGHIMIAGRTRPATDAERRGV